jgi:hypothetical protein
MRAAWSILAERTVRPSHMFISLETGLGYTVRSQLLIRR